MSRRIAVLIVLMVLFACAAGAWFVVRASSDQFVAPGAAHVRVTEIGPGRREISYTMPNPADGWQSVVARRLDRSGWNLATDPRQWGGTENITVLSAYVRVSHIWFFTVRERAELFGDRSSATIRVSYSLSTQR